MSTAKISEQINEYTQRYCALLMGGIFAVLYTFGASPFPQASDASELMLLSASNGVAHPPGYPVLLLWLRFWNLLPIATVAFKASMGCALLSASALGFLADALQSFMHKNYPKLATRTAVWTVLFLGFQPYWIRYSTIAEAFSIAALVFSIWIWLWVKEVSLQRSWLLGLSFVLMIGGHHTTILAFPLLLAVMCRYRFFWPQQLSGIFLGLCSYALLLGNVTGWSWGELHHFEELLHHFLRRDYGTFQITHAQIGSENLQLRFWQTPLVYLWDLSKDSLGWMPLLFLIGLYQIRKQWKEHCWILCSWLCSSLLLLSLFSLPTDFAYITHSNRFFMAPTILLMPIIAFGIARLFAMKSSIKWLLWAIPLGQLLYFFPIAGRFDKRMMHFVSNACAVLPPKSMAVIAGDGAVFSMLYAQQILGLCSDVQFIFPKMLSYQWYKENLKQQGIIESNLQQIVAKGMQEHDVFALLGVVGNTEQNLPDSVPYAGMWMQFIPDNAYFPTPQEVEGHLLEIMPNLQYQPTSQHEFLWNRAAEAWSTQQYAETWKTLAGAYQTQNQPVDAQRCLTLAQMFKEGDWWSVEPVIQQD